MKQIPGWLRTKTSIPTAIPPRLRPATSPTTSMSSSPSTTTSPANQHPPTNVTASAVFRSLAYNPRPWTLTRHLSSENPSDLHGELKGIATFQLKHGVSSANGNGDGENVNGTISEMVYKEEGQTPAPPNLRGVGGMRWTKKYIWQLEEGGTDDGGGRIGVWFVKITDNKAKNSDSTSGAYGETGREEEDQKDYLFHELHFSDAEVNDELSSGDKATSDSGIDFPPHLQQQRTFSDEENFTVLTARGHHLCINDTYQTTYSFKVIGEGSSAKVMSWASRHTVHGPKKKQVILNVYERG